MTSSLNLHRTSHFRSFMVKRMAAWRSKRTGHNYCVPLKCPKQNLISRKRTLSMEQAKNKRGDDGRVGGGGGGKRVRTGGEQTVKEEEVEEFFAILRRIRVAVEYFGKGGRDSTEKRWRPSFKKEDFDGVAGGSNGDKREGSLDLNSDPPPSKDTA